MMNKSNPLVSIIIPSYNVERYLSDACDSVLAQTYSNWEAIIVDDGSSKDNTAKVAESYCEKDSRFIYIYQENKGLSGARKTGIDAAKGEFIQFLDADDALMPERLQEMVNASSKVEDNIILYSDFWIGLNDSVKGGVVNHTRLFSYGKDVNFYDMYTAWRESFLFVPACPFFPKSLFDKIVYDETLRSVEDWDLYLSILTQGFLFRPIYTKNIVYRDNPNGLSQNKNYIYTQLFLVLNKWRKNSKLVSKDLYTKSIANLYAEVLIQHYWKNKTNKIKPQEVDAPFLFRYFSFYFLLKKILIIVRLSLKKRGAKWLKM